MAREKKPFKEEEMEGAPEWMVTFSDCMTLLLTFFVLLLSFSSFDEREFRRLRVIYCDAFNTINSRRQSIKEAMLPSEQFKFQEELDEGSDKSTHEDGTEGALKESHKDDFKKHKVFLIPSDQIFIAKGSALSKNGKKTLSTMAKFLKRMPGRLVIGENNKSKSIRDTDIAMRRAWAIIDYMNKNGGLSHDRFSICADSIVGKKGFALFNLDTGKTNPERIVEIILLEKNLYN
jgi:chemotaxis protein MotB